MIFRPALAAKVMAGEKTVTRRLPSRDNPRSPWWIGGCAYKPGQVFAVNPGRGELRVGNARVVSVRLVTLHPISDVEARREGFADAHEFNQVFRAINGGLDPKQLVWRVEFEALA